MKHHTLVVDFSNLDFEKINIEIPTDGTKKKEETTAIVAVGGTDIAEVGSSDTSQKDVATAPTC